jgi:hypothetical protein
VGFPQGSFVAGSTNGFVAGAVAQGDVESAFFDGTDWGASSVIATTNAVGFWVASNGTGYALAYNDFDAVPENHVYALVSNGSSWGSPTVVSSGDVDSGSDVRLVSNGSGYAVAYGLSASGVFEGAVYDQGAWTTPQEMSNGTYNVGDLLLATDGSGYAAVYSDYDNFPLFARRWSSSWQAEETLASGLYSNVDWFAVAGLGGEWTAVWTTQYAAGVTGAFARSFVGGAWSATVPLFDVDRAERLWLGYDGVSRTLLWSQGSPGDARLTSIWSYPAF